MAQFQCAASGPTTGCLTDYHLATLGHYALKGAGLVFVEATGVQANGRVTPNCPGLWCEAQVAAAKRVVDLVHGVGGLIGVQLAHGGRKTSVVPPWMAGELEEGRRSLRAGEEMNGWPDNVVGPSGGQDDMWSADGIGHWTPRELSVPEVQDVVEAFADSARRAVLAGFDTIEIHAAHGYLLHEFLSPITNKRTDRYGGDFQGRTRLLMEVIEAVRAAIPAGMPLMLRISATEWMDGSEEARGRGSWNIESTLRLVRLLPALGIDLLDVSSGGNHEAQAISSELDYQTALSGQIRNTVRRESLALLVGAMGRITDAVQARDLLEDMFEMPESHAPGDVVFVGRQFLREPEWVLKAAWKLGVDVAWPAHFGKIGLSV